MTDKTPSELVRLEEENRYLRQTVAAVREEMERQRELHEERVQKAQATATDEVVHLRNSVEALRGELEQISDRHREVIQKLEKSMRDELSQLQNMIAALREHMEGDNGG